MGNKSLKQIKIDGYPEKKNSMVLTSSASGKEKDPANKEKKNMKLICENNEQSKEASLIEECFVNHCFLRALERKIRQEIIKGMSLYSVKSKIEIFKQGEAPGNFYIISNGTCEVFINGEKKKHYKEEIILGILPYYMV